MGDSDKERIAALEAVVWRDAPRFARGLCEGRPRRPREYRCGRAWPVMALAAVVAGGVVPHGLLLAAGLVMAALAVNLFDTRDQWLRQHRRGRERDSGGPW
ncbi:DUF3040 domain-containing protein [Streptomyces litmocidini]|uniref:DUF3040 domain-containing protein n=1 Tax=Streptomyces litmocidini TaxID=67318 RepID=UPI0036F86FC3